MTLLHVSGLKRRERLLLVAVFVFCVVSFVTISSPPATLLESAPRIRFKDAFPSGLFSGRKRTDDVLRYVDPLIGTLNGGHVFPGASLPYGMAKPAPDTDSHGENAAGYVSDFAPLLGFSHLHDSGTGGSASMGNFPIWVHPGCPHDDYRRCDYTVQDRATMRVNDSAIAYPGYFAVNVTNGVRAEMTATQHAALYRFTLPGAGRVNYTSYRYQYGGSRPHLDHRNMSVPNSPLLLVDLTDLSGTRSSGGLQVYPSSGRIIGDGTFSPSFGIGAYEAYFCLDVRTDGAVRRSGTFWADRAVEEPKYVADAAPGPDNPTGNVGGWLQFEQPPSEQLLVRVGLSFMSVDRACRNAEAEIADFGFDRVVEEAQDAWRDKLAAVAVDDTGVSDELRTMFWSGLYRSLLSPQNYTGENPLWNSTEPYFDSFYCIWDSFRAQHPLITIVDPAAQAQMVRTLLDVYRFEGKLPDCRMTFCKGFTQGGSNADVVIADSYLKNITDGIDWQLAYEAVVSDAEDTPQDWSFEGRGNLQSWHRLGYIAWDHIDSAGNGPHTRTVSRTVEYAYNDFCIAQMAGGLGHPGDVKKYADRGGNWRNVWREEQRDLYRDADGDVVVSPFTGFMMPRRQDGSWKYQNTRTCTPGHEPLTCFLDTGMATYEGSPWLYSFYVPQDMAALAELIGGREGFVERLNYYHESGIVYMGNEQSFLTVYQFHYGGRPGLSSYWLHRYVPSQFNATVNGIPGNDDCAMGAFSTFFMMGFFPVAGQDVYLLTPPFFPEVRLRTRGDRPAIIRKVLDVHELRARDEDTLGGGEERRRWESDPFGNEAGGESGAIYVQRATLDGEPYTRSWITHDFFLRGGVLELVVGSRESDWGTGEEDLPPSWSTSEAGARFRD